MRPGIVHRLDKGTSGLLVVAKDEATHRGLCAQFQARSVERTYVSVVSGVPEPASGDVVSLIGRDPRDRKRMAVVDHVRRGRHAASGYRMLEALPGARFERVLHPVFEQDEATLIAVGCLLGGLVGLAQVPLY